MTLSERANENLHHKILTLQHDIEKYEQCIIDTRRELRIAETQLACEHDFQKNGKFAECIARYECLRCGVTTFDVEGV
jgi:hypothetical protein